MRDRRGFLEILFFTAFTTFFTRTDFLLYGVVLSAVAHVALSRFTTLPLTRALLGGGRLNAPPQVFSRIAKKRRRAAPSGFHPPYPPSFPHFCENFSPRSCEVRSPRSCQVTQLQNNFPSRHGYNVSGKVLKLSEYDEVISAYKTYILDF